MVGQFGIGLSLAKDVITRHGGTIAVNSDVEKTSFTLTLPH
ncbi:ATP-binding protein [Streptococcus alactolyticus]|uniref:histidine kinase n=1 Tax=Streptococcus alactolyticus TaxID=29389 RepID=A0A6N7X0Z9_STRAY|nr:hypothetical protein [Streptococcus alactolyticus]